MITVIVLTQNNQKTIAKTLDSLKNFSEVLVLDSGSTDDTLKIVKNYPNVTIHTSPFLGFGPMRNYAAKLASHDWILSIDSDEVLTKDLEEEILLLKLDPECIYSIQRHNFFNGKRIKWCGGWHPDVVLRLYNRKKTQYSANLVHEKIVEKDYKITPLKAPLLHTPYLEIGDFLHKMQHYTALFATQHAEKKSSIFQALTHSWYAFIKSYFLKRGFLGGREGFIISIYNGHTTFYKYLKLAQRKEKL